MTSSSDRIDRIERILEGLAIRQEAFDQRQEAFDQRQEAISQQQQISIRLIELLGQRVDSNAQAIEHLTSDVATTRASVDGLVQTITEFSVRTEARLNRLDDVVADIRTTNQRLEQILEQLIQRNGNQT